MRDTLRRRKAFTLIELLVVVGIIAVLIAILLPNLSKARDKARLTVCQTRIRGWGQGFLMYAGEFNNALPLDGGDGTSALPIGKWSDSWLWFNGVTSYMGAKVSYDQLQTNAKANSALLPKAGFNSFFICPSAGDAAAGVGDVMDPNGFFQTVGWYSTSPVFAETRPMLLCYGMNSQLRQWDSTDANYQRNPPQQGDISSLTRLKPPAMVPLVAEKRIRPDELPINDPNYSKNLAQTKVTANRFTARHNKGGNIAFADGHVEWFNNAEINRGALKTNFYNIPNLLMWNPSNRN
jgi:prepilin-type processing-associated H-X9-DG protein/prepilin-type N-terminal cleavage/methylation domain-containing protein